MAVSQRAPIATTAEVPAAPGVPARKTALRPPPCCSSLPLAVYPLSYYGQFRGQKLSSIAFPWHILITAGVGLTASAWGVASGFSADQLQEITSTATACGHARQRLRDRNTAGRA